MTKRYTGGVISSSLPTVNAAAASGVFLLSQQADYQSRNSWPPFKVEESLRFRSSASAYLNRTPASAGNRKTWTWSAWVKLGTIGASNGTLFSAGTTSGGSSRFYLRYTGSQFQTGYGSFNLDTTVAVFRDPSAWYHVVIAIDTTQATTANRLKIYVNGIQQSVTTDANYSQNDDTAVNNTVTHSIARDHIIPGGYFDGYMSEVYLIDGQALTPSSFGATDKDGNWSPIAYTGTYGTNGFYVNFRDNTSATTMGYDYSGNGNNWTLNGFNVSTANTSYDIMFDVPEDQSGANTRGNYATLNSLDPKNGTQSNGNLTHAMGSNDYAAARSTIGMKGGKWYWEAKCETTLQSNYYMGIGVTADGDYSGYNYIGSTSGGYSYDGRALKLNNNSSTSYGASYTLNDIIGVALDLDNGTIEYYKNGASQGVAYTGIDTTRTYYAAHWIYTTQISYNFGQQPLAYTPPTGFKSLNTFNLPEPTIKQPNKYFDATLYAGNNGTQSVINAGNFQPDLVWLKNRTNAYTHLLYDAIRGVGTLKAMSSSETSAEGGLSDNSTFGYLSALNSNGFTVVSGSTAGSYTNSSSNNYVGWQWNAGGANTTNTNGSVTSIVRNNPTAGFSIVTYNTGSAGTQTVGHGLGVTPAMIWIKSRISATAHWDVWHKSFANPAQGYMYLNLTNAVANDARNYSNTAPTSSLFTYESGYEFNANQNYVAYFWAEIEGYSKFGSYTGNGSTDGPFVYTGFRPRIIIAKASSTAGYNWVLFDSARSPTNVASAELYPNLANAEGTDSSFDLLSNGFKLRVTSGNKNLSGTTYIYAAFAEMPFKYARSR